MWHVSLKVIIALFAALLPLGACPAEEMQKDKPYIILRENLECVIANIERYKATGSNPIVILLRSCPEINIGSQVLLKAAQNQAPTLKPSSRGEGEPETVIVLTRNELSCLANYVSLLKNSRDNVVSIPAKICDP
jgi:hypothetical protein